jgi:hypothetical protein
MTLAQLSHGRIRPQLYILHVQERHCILENTSTRYGNGTLENTQVALGNTNQLSIEGVK